MLLILSEDTNYDRGMLNFEIENAVDVYDLPAIVAYTGCNYLLDPKKYSSRWPKALKERIDTDSINTTNIIVIYVVILYNDIKRRSNK